MIITDDIVRECTRYLKEKFLGWKTPPVELPAESVIEDVVRHILARKEIGDYLTGIEKGRSAALTEVMDGLKFMLPKEHVTNDTKVHFGWGLAIGDAMTLVVEISARRYPK